MRRRAADDRRTAPPREIHQPGAARRVLPALLAGLYRPLAEDDERVAHWLRHVRVGVLVSEAASWSVVGYVLVTDSPGRHSLAILVAAAVVIVACPCVFLLPLGAMMRDSRGPALFHVWSLVQTAVVLVVVRLDGGSSSPLGALLFLALAYAAVACSPSGVVAVGGGMTVGYLLVVELPAITPSGLFLMVIMASLTSICATASANTWATYDRQLALLRQQEVLAATDALTGLPNRRAFLDRVTAAVSDAAWGHLTVVCLIDLDGFKSVNDAGGDAAGDAVLRAVATALGSAVRETDTVARLGGDEFAVLADVSIAFSGEMLAERLRTAVAGVGGSSGVTASVGIVEVQPGDDVQDLLNRADAAMYRSKVAGGDRVTALVS